ncbi:type II secretion system F family protein [Paenibacillus sp. LHD-117]|uniref:type II secretion system F family protein n=1 Tax=Paenibacillus sp. LHD-117 TaxID=3071412 RepID=UPI0027DEF476|nr:type II secretion system F family protein [Paenibacillus sp. LHD-117]MDQ6422645.1 type II secretion system F family protein [Paenibacillus sp. LHD-117]
MTGIILFVVWIVFIIAIIQMVRQRKRHRISEYERWVSRKKVEATKLEKIAASFNVHSLVKERNLVLLLSTPIGVLFALGFHYLLGLAWGIGFVVGTLAPWLIVILLYQNYERSFQKDGRISIEFLHSILTAGGSVEEWIREVGQQLDGPLRPIFEKAVRNWGTAYTTPHLIEELIKKSPDSYLKLVFTGILHEYRNSGDMVKYTEEVMADIINQERFERLMKVQRQSGQSMLLFVGGFPIFMYVLFQPSIQRTLELHPGMNIVMLVGALGYVGFIWYGLHATKSSVL